MLKAPVSLIIVFSFHTKATGRIKNWDIQSLPAKQELPPIDVSPTTITIRQALPTLCSLMEKNM